MGEGNQGDPLDAPALQAGAADALAPVDANQLEFVSRSTIYKNRILGDELLKKGKRSRMGYTLKEVILFVCYAVVAGIWVFLRADVHTAFQINNSVKQTLGERSFINKPSGKSFHNITSMHDFELWFKRALIPNFFLAHSSLTMFTSDQYFRLVPLDTSEPPADTAATVSPQIRLTLRKIKNDKGFDIGGPRFGWWLPAAWSDFELPENSLTNHDEQTNINQTYTWSRNVPAEARPLTGIIGAKESDPTSRIYAEDGVIVGDRISVTWPFTSESAYNNIGGFTAIINLEWNGDISDLTPQEIVDKVLPYQVVQLADFETLDVVSQDVWTETEVVSMYLEDFFGAGFMDEYAI